MVVDFSLREFYLCKPQGKGTRQNSSHRTHGNKQPDTETDSVTTTPELGSFWASKVEFFLTRQTTATCVVGV